MPILITTSRRPSRRTRTFAKELVRVIPNSIKINRGKMSLDDLKEYMIRRGYTRLIIINTKKGNPSQLIFYVLDYEGLKRVLIFNIRGLSLQIDKKIKRYVRYIRDVIDLTRENEDLKETFIEFLSIPSIALNREEGEDAFIEIDKDNQGNLIIRFVTEEGNLIPPYMRGYIYEFRGSKVQISKQDEAKF